MKQLTIKGTIRVSSYGDCDDVLYISGESEPLIQVFDELQDQTVSLKFYSSPEEMPIEQLREEVILSLAGAVDASLEHTYSDITGYLWTKQDLSIGDHDLLDILENYIGKYVYIEVTIH